MRVVLDTNVMLSALFWSGPSARIVALSESGLIEVCTSVTILEEVESVLAREKFARYARDRDLDLEEALEKYALLSKIVTPSLRLSVCRDPRDDKFLECALEARARYLVSGDKDLLALGKLRDVRILTPANFLREPPVKWLQLRATVARAWSRLRQR